MTTSARKKDRNASTKAASSKSELTNPACGISSRRYIQIAASIECKVTAVPARVVASKFSWNFNRGVKLRYQSCCGLLDSRGLRVRRLKARVAVVAERADQLGAVSDDAGVGW